MKRRYSPIVIPRIISAAAVCVAATAGLLVSCKDEISGPGPTSGEIQFPDSNVSYGEHVQPLFNQRCAIPGCHDSGSRQDDLVLESYLEATAKPGIIVPRNPDASILVQRLEGTLQPRMPFNRPPLSENQIMGIRQWILEGAENN